MQIVSKSWEPSISWKRKGLSWPVMGYLDLVACEVPEQRVTVCVAWKIVGLWKVEGCSREEFTTKLPHHDNQVG